MAQARETGHLLQDIESELAAIRSDVPGTRPASPPARVAPSEAPVAATAPPLPPEARIIDTRPINLSPAGLAKAREAAVARKTLQQRLAEVKPVDESGSD